MRSRALFVKPQGSILVIGIMTMANGWIVGPGQRKLSTWNEAFRVSSQPTFRYWVSDLFFTDISGSYPFLLHISVPLIPFPARHVCRMSHNVKIRESPLAAEETPSALHAVLVTRRPQTSKLLLQQIINRHKVICDHRYS